MNMSSGKSYGLQISKKSKQTVSKHSAFNESNSDDSGSGATDWVKKMQKSSKKSLAQQHASKELKKAMEQDSSVFQYDEIYDQMDQKRTEASTSRDRDKKPRYIHQLLNTADRRKRENERRIERQAQKEREAEGDQFKDKEKFVTSAYKKKLEEFAAFDEEEKRQNMLEEIGDVTKQQDISGFYRHLYQSTVNDQPEEKKNSKASNGSNAPSNSKKPSREVNSNSHSSKRKEMKNDDKLKKNRQYRKRKISESSDDHKKDSRKNSSSESYSESDVEAKPVIENSNKKKVVSISKEMKGTSVSSKDTMKSPQKSVVHEKQPEPPQTSVAPKTVKKPGPDLKIWEKRTVGPVYEAALKRYLERKSTKSRSG